MFCRVIDRAPRAGIEPCVAGLKGRHPHRLDERGMWNAQRVRKWVGSAGVALPPSVLFPPSSVGGLGCFYGSSDRRYTVSATDPLRVANRQQKSPMSRDTGLCNRTRLLDLASEAQGVRPTIHRLSGKRLRTTLFGDHEVSENAHGSCFVKRACRLNPLSGAGPCCCYRDYWMRRVTELFAHSMKRFEKTEDPWSGAGHCVSFRH